MRTWGKYLEDRALHFWATKQIDFSGPFSGPLVDLFWTILDLSWTILDLFRLVLGRAGPPGPPSDFQGVSLRGFFFPENEWFFWWNCVLCVFSKKWLLGQDCSPIFLLFLHSNPIHFIFFSNPLHLHLRFLIVSLFNWDNGVPWGLGISENK